MEPISYVSKIECNKLLEDDSHAILFADLSEIQDDSEKDVKTLATEIFSRIQQKGLSPIATLFLNQQFNFNQQKGEDLISGTISTVCSLSSTPVILILTNAEKVQQTNAFKTFIDILNDKYTGQKDFPTFEKVIISNS